MANFAVHLNTSAFVSGVGALSLAKSQEEAFIYFFAGIIGGILPDIDHNNSTPTKILQFFFSNIFAFLITSNYVGVIPIGNIFFIWIGSYVVANFIFLGFKNFTIHRGIIHSIPSAFVAFFLITIVSYNFFGISIYKSYLIGFFVFLGYIAHLILDEIYSVDIRGMRIKKSFGSAFKFFGELKATIIVYFILITLLYFLPEKEILLNLIKRIINVNI